MKTIAITAIFTIALMAFGPQTALAQVAEASAAAAAPLSGARLVGQGVLRFLGFEIYRARLWVQPGFDADNYAAHPLALELTYHRDFSADAIAKRSIEEMRRVGSFTPQQATRWHQALAAALPDVKAGDRLLGLYQPGAGAMFKMGGRVVGELDPTRTDERTLGALMALGVTCSSSAASVALRSDATSLARP